MQSLVDPHTWWPSSSSPLRKFCSVGYLESGCCASINELFMRISRNGIQPAEYRWSVKESQTLTWPHKNERSIMDFPVCGFFCWKQVFMRALLLICVCVCAYVCVDKMLNLHTRKEDVHTLLHFYFFPRDHETPSTQYVFSSGSLFIKYMSTCIFI